MAVHALVFVFCQKIVPLIEFLKNCFNLLQAYMVSQAKIPQSKQSIVHLFQQQRKLNPNNCLTENC
jgi:hypothetical protein